MGKEVWCGVGNHGNATNWLPDKCGGVLNILGERCASFCVLQILPPALTIQLVLEAVVCG